MAPRPAPPRCLVSSMTLTTESAARTPQTIAPHLTTPGGPARGVSEERHHATAMPSVHTIQDSFTGNTNTSVTRYSRRAQPLASRLSPASRGAAAVPVGAGRGRHRHGKAFGIPTPQPATRRTSPSSAEVDGLRAGIGSAFACCPRRVLVIGRHCERPHARLPLEPRAVEQLVRHLPVELEESKTDGATDGLDAGDVQVRPAPWSARGA